MVLCCHLVFRVSFKTNKIDTQTHKLLEWTVNGKPFGSLDQAMKNKEFLWQMLFVVE